MKAISSSLLTLTLGSASLLSADALPSPFVAARVSSILERFPADAADARDALCGEIIGLGPAALAETFARVQPPGGTNDAKARFAVNGLAVYVTRQGAESERLGFVKGLLAALGASRDLSLIHI